MKRLLFLMLALVLAVTAFAPAAAAKTQSTKGLEGLTEEQIEKSLKEIEYIFTKIIVSEKKVSSLMRKSLRSHLIRLK